MWRQRRAWLLFFGIVVVLLVVGFEPTYRVRGWLRGEACFNGRPTSYWRVKLDHWLTQFIHPDDAVRAMILHNGAEAVDGVVLLRPDRHPVWDRLRDLFQSEEARDRQWDTPEVLMGNPEAAAVLEELAREERFRAVTERALNH